MVSKIKLLLIAGFILPLCSLGQSRSSEKNDGIYFPLQLFNFIDAINRSINNLFEEEKAAGLYRNLGYFEQDVHDYLDARSVLIDQIKTGKFNVKSKESKPLITSLRFRLGKLQKRFNVLKVDVENSIKNGDSIVHAAAMPLRANDTEVFTPLEDLINGQSSEKIKQQQLTIILEESERIRQAFDRVITSVISARNQLKQKFNM